MDKNKDYISFLETVIKVDDTESLLKTASNIIRKTFNVEKIQVWEKTSLPNCYSVSYEYPECKNDSMLKMRLKMLPEEVCSSLEKTKTWSWQEITDETLTKFKINSLVGIEINLPKNNKGILVLTNNKTNFKLSNEELGIITKYISALENRLIELEQLEKSATESKRLTELHHVLKEKEHQRGNFINNIAHELKTPLASIIGFSKFLISKELTANQYKELAEQIIEAANRLSSLISDFLQINKLDSGGWSVNTELCDIGELIKKSSEEFSKLDKNHKITYKIPGQYPSIKTDPKLLRQVIDNLISNAIKYSPHGGNINVSINMPKDKEFAILIQDQGLGIDKEELPKIFNRFYRARNVNEAGARGTGLGLSICKEIVDALNGKIEVESNIGQGTTFKVLLPIN